MEKELPKNWERVGFTEIFGINGGTQPPKSQFIHEPKEGYIRLLQIRDFGKKPVPTYIPNTGKLRTCEKDDILIARYGASIGRIVTGEEGAYNVALAKVNIPEVMNKNFVKWLLKSHIFQNKIVSFQRTAQSGFNKDDLSGIIIPLPPLAEQQCIVTKLDELFGHLDSLKTRLNHIPQILKNFRQAVLNQAVTGKLTEEWRVGKALEKWEETTIGKLFTVKTGATPKRGNTTYYKEGKIPWLKSGQVKNEFIYEAEEFITDLAVKETNAKLYPKDTLLVAMYGEGKTRGQVGWMKLEAASNQAIAALVNEEMDIKSKQYVYYYCLSQYLEIRKQAEGGNQPNLNLTKIKNWKISLPSKEEQTEIVKRVEHLFAKADAIEAQYESLKTKIDSLPQAILAKAFKGELVEQLDTDGSAAVLLEEIQQLKESVSKKTIKTRKKKKK
ncbi:restriction endonuclease subunit S [Algibacter lectus]|uniref:restriction endonuclease subunit S n=1 Tax=Algibacter lectus TaxID=221126 RepID=UPI0026F1C969|nr:restriction endonuclease subunit S [Algibacter lectus]MDO7135952.1 restriction endonuclease subunit S [Algibacter lectus]